MTMQVYTNNNAAENTYDVAVWLDDTKVQEDGTTPLAEWVMWDVYGNATPGGITQAQHRQNCRRESVAKAKLRLRELRREARKLANMGAPTAEPEA